MLGLTSLCKKLKFFLRAIQGKEQKKTTHHIGARLVTNQVVEENSKGVSAAGFDLVIKELTFPKVDVLLTVARGNP